MTYSYLLVDDPAPLVRRVTLNRPEKRNAMHAPLRAEILSALREAEGSQDVRAVIIRGAGKGFCAGYDLSPDLSQEQHGGFAGNPGGFQRNVIGGWMSIWDLSTPVIAQVHGHCLAGGSELATGCDLVYVAEDALIGYPAVRFGVPDMQYHVWLLGMRKAMELVLTGDSMTGSEAVEHGFANRAYPADELDDQTLVAATRVAQIPPDVAAMNKRTVHRAMEHMGMRGALRAGTEASALATHTAGFTQFMAEAEKSGLTRALSKRDGKFGDGRTA